MDFFASFRWFAGFIYKQYRSRCQLKVHDIRLWLWPKFLNVDRFIKEWGMAGVDLTNYLALKMDHVFVKVAINHIPS